MIYARLEEVSFRSGVVACTGALVVAGTAIALALTLGGHQAVPRPAGAGAVMSSAGLSPQAVPPPSARPSPEPAAPGSVIAAGGYYAPDTAVSPVPAAHASQAPSPTLPPAARTRRTHPAEPPASPPPGWPLPWTWPSPWPSLPSPWPSLLPGNSE